MKTKKKIRRYREENRVQLVKYWLHQKCHTYVALAGHVQVDLLTWYLDRKIHMLQELAQTMLIHANICWPKALTVNLWPYALCMANNVLCESPNMQHPQ